MALPKPSPRIRKRKPLTSRLALEPLEDRTLPSATTSLLQPIHFSADSIQRLNDFLSTTFIPTGAVKGVTATELDFFGNLPSPASGADQLLLNSILTKLHYIDSLSSVHGQFSLALAVGLRTDIDAFVADNPELNTPLNARIAGFTAPQVAFSLASFIETTLGSTRVGNGNQVPESPTPQVPFLFLVDLARAARSITTDSFTSLDSLRVGGLIQNAINVNLFQFTAPRDGRLLVQLAPETPDGLPDNDFQGGLTLLNELGGQIPEQISEGGRLLEVPVFGGETYLLQAKLLAGETDHYTLFFVEVFGSPSLDSIGSLFVRGPETAVTPVIQPTAVSSPGLAFDLAAPLAGLSIGTTFVDSGGEDTQDNPPVGDPNPIPPERLTPPTLAPGGVDELLERYRPKVSQRSAVSPLISESSQLQPFMETDPVDQPSLVLGIDLPDSPQPFARSADVTRSAEDVAETPVPERSVVDSAFIALSDPPARAEAALDPFAHASSACVTIGEPPDFAAVVSSVAVAVLAQGGLLLALHRPEDEPLTSLSRRE